MWIFLQEFIGSLHFMLGQLFQFGVEYLQTALGIAYTNIKTVDYEGFFNTTFTYGKVISEKTMEKVKNIDYTYYSMKLLNYYSIASEYLYRNTKAIYDSNETFREVIDYIFYTNEYLRAVVYEYRIEPRAKTWLSISFMFNNLFFTENFHKDSNFEEGLELLDIVKDMYSISESLIKENDTIHECLFTLCYDNNYLFKTCSRTHISYPETIELAKSSVKFLSIEYSHEKMAEPIVLDISDNYYMVGNELWSVSFVKRMLEYQSKPYYFDSDYVLHIMDNTINEIELTSKQFIRLEKEKYVIHNYE